MSGSSISIRFEGPDSLSSYLATQFRHNGRGQFDVDEKPEVRVDEADARIFVWQGPSTAPISAAKILLVGSLPDAEQPSIEFPGTEPDVVSTAQYLVDFYRSRSVDATFDDHEGPV